MIDPTILCHPNIPKPLHGVNPRTIFGKEWWDEQRHIAYAEYGFHCSACGTHKSKALFHKWLEAHEFYLYDYENGRITFDHLVPLCHACHNYIHDGRLSYLTRTGEIPEEKYRAIMDHGNGIVKSAGLEQERLLRHQVKTSARWEDWRMVVDGKEYGPSTQSFAEWERGLWRGWSP